MLYKKLSLEKMSTLQKENATTAMYKGQKITVITVFKDIDIAIVEDEEGNIFDIKNSLICG